MKLILKNNSSDAFTYAAGTVTVPAEGLLDVNSRYWFSLLSDLVFIRDLRQRSVVINDGLEDYEIDEAEEYLFNIVTTMTNRDSDGSSLQRTKITTTGWHYQVHGVEFETSKLNSIESKKVDGTDYGYSAMKFYKLVDGVETLITGEELTQEFLDANCVKTIMDWEPTHDVEILGGLLRMLSVPAQNLRLWTIGVPDVPEVMGGSKVFAANVNLKFIGLEGVDVDGKTPKYLTYNAVYHTTKIRLMFRHPAGFKHPIMMCFKLFKA